jgi:Fur family ferric uptake transcriptional regulator
LKLRINLNKETEMSFYEEKVAEYLRKNGLKFTPERKAIMTYVSTIKGHFTPDDIYDCLKKANKKISRASIYRALPLLLKSGIVREAARDKSGAKYEYAAGKSHHDHMECVKCGKIVEFRNEEIEKLQDSVGRQYGFVLTGHRLELKGLCRECSRSK